MLFFELALLQSLGSLGLMVFEWQGEHNLSFFLAPAAGSIRILGSPIAHPFVLLNADRPSSPWMAPSMVGRLSR